MTIVGKFNGITIKSLEYLEKCLQIINESVPLSFCLQRDGAGNPMLFTTNGGKNLVISVSENYPTLAIRYVINALTNEFPHEVPNAKKKELADMVKRDKQQMADIIKSYLKEASNE